MNSTIQSNRQPNTSAAIKAGFDNPVLGAQAVFRHLLKSMSEPGYVSAVEALPDCPQTLYSASYAIALGLFDQDTRIFLSDSLKNDENVVSLRFHTSLTLVDDLSHADFVLCNESEIPELAELNAGVEAYPDQSCTLIVQCESFTEGAVYQATGPGIETSRSVNASGLTPSLYAQRLAMAKRFPLGIDMIFTHQEQLFCLPRTTILNPMS